MSLRSDAPLYAGSRGDAFFGQIALRRGYVTPQVLSECIDAQQEQILRSETPFRLGQLLLKRKALSLEQFLEILREQKRSVLSCPKCGSVYDLGNQAVEASVFCLRCEESLSFSAPEPSPMLGRYRILREIARGGMGVIYEAEDPELARKVALKVLREGDGSREWAERFRQEAVLTARLSHPNIIRIHEVATLREGSSGIPIHYIAMEYIDGETLEDAADVLPFGEKLRVFEKIVAAMAHAHQHGVFHRDLKPSNVLLNREGEPILIDFGLARWSGTPGRLTVTGEILGTFPYMAPEQVERKGPLDARTDVWGLGVLLYELLAGESPFPFTDPARLCDAILHSDPVSPHLRVGRIDRGLASICLKAMEKSRERRYPDAGELLLDLRRWSRGENIEAAPHLIGYRLGKWFRRRRAQCLFILAGFLLVAAGWYGAQIHSRGSLFQEARHSAEIAFAAGEWEKALALSELALDRRFDPQVLELAERCRLRIAEGKAQSHYESDSNTAANRTRFEECTPVGSNLRE